MSPIKKLGPMLEQFQAIGHPNYSDVVDRGFVWPTYDEAKADGENFLRAGNWSSFQIVKHFTLAPVEEAGGSMSSSGEGPNDGR